jgi:hypothetical protein
MVTRSGAGTRFDETAMLINPLGAGMREGLPANSGVA